MEPVDESVREPPGTALRSFVGWYSGYRQAGVAPTRHRGLPSPYLTLILTLDDPLTVIAHPDPGQAPGDFRLLLGGLHTAPALISHEGRQSGVRIALSPSSVGLGSSPGLGLAGLAVDAGYYDQAHMDREFNALAGCPPIAWLAEEFRNIQSGAANSE